MNAGKSETSTSPTDTRLEGISAAIGAYNEAPSLESVFNEVMAVLRSTGRPYELCIVDDGSTDGTSELADRLAASTPGVKVIHHGVNMGIGPTIRDAITSGTLPYYIGLPGDGQFPASIISQFLPLIEKADIVLGYVPDLEKGRPPLLAFFSWAERLLIHILFGPLPHFQGVPMYRRSWLNQIKLTSSGRGWMMQMEIVIRALRSGARIVTAPTPIRPREHGTSRATSFRNILSNVKQLFALWFHLTFDKS
jgi:glycosyltransferase involved in cell wall biosynthesis